MTDTIDRFTPTQRPAERTVMFQRWSQLLFLHWEVPADALRRLIPPALTLDTFEGKAYIGLVPFTMSGIRPVWSPAVPGLSAFHEINVRTYVHHQGQNPGVWFFSLDAANTVAVRLARALFKLPYYRAAMSLRQRPGEAGGEEITYTTERLFPPPTPAAASLRYTPCSGIQPARPGTLDYFLAERYLLYTTAGERLYRGQVYHTPYPLQRAVLHDLSENLIAVAGIARPDTEPIVHYALEVRVRIYRLHRIL